MELIERQAVFDSLEKVADLFPYKVVGDADTYSQYNEAWNDAIGRAEMEIEKLPSARPGRKKGHWFGDEYGSVWECNVCGLAWQLNEGTPQDNQMNYCPKCGADMRGKQNDD